MSVGYGARPSTPAAAIAALGRAAAAARARRRARWIRAAVGLSLASLLAVGVWAVGFSSLLAVRYVTVAGLGRLSAAEVTAAARVPTGGPLIRLDSDGPLARVRALPAVASARLERHLPHTVRIVVTERTPVLVLATPTGRRLVDATGVVFAPDDGKAAGLPVVRSTRPDLPPGTLTAVVGMLTALPADVRADVQVVRAEVAEDMAVELSDGRVIVWGDASRPELKSRVLQVLMQRQGRTYDVSSPEAPAITRP